MSTAHTSTIDSIARPAPTSLMTDETIAFENPESSMTLPKIAPSRNTGKYSFTKPTILSMNRPVNIGATRLGSVNSTAPSAATGANRMTLKPR